MIKVSRLIELLQTVPPDWYAYGYEGEVRGVVVAASMDDIGGVAIRASEREDDEHDQPAFEAELQNELLRLRDLAEDRPA